VSVETDITFFKELLPDMLAESEGQWVLIKDSKLVDIFPTNAEAYAAGVKEFGGPPFLVREIRRDEPVEML